MLAFWGNPKHGYRGSQARWGCPAFWGGRELNFARHALGHGSPHGDLGGPAYWQM